MGDKKCCWWRLEWLLGNSTSTCQPIHTNGAPGNCDLILGLDG